MASKDASGLVITVAGPPVVSAVELLTYIGAGGVSD